MASSHRDGLVRVQVNLHAGCSSTVLQATHFELDVHTSVDIATGVMNWIGKGGSRPCGSHLQELHSS